ncbi:uncharacterized protein LOC121290734 isoform X1 [Carcharodon carcharias]|uniref:uncharacterized protein LOC121290734 isoform X1 n=1 Tax=Carcharodon carcharias TaxID=13397 RepID=UPI001B7D935C|nr:uncharacterized protein LOC121290734 isoform X1 [Carcharodon carcharias]XP_041067517.1 uncharacterized protein LOC121290734 isoform X1 [Carcharodon carcharias]
MSRCLKGGVVISHQILEGKHHYEVQDVLHCNVAHSLFRRGDHLLHLNEESVFDIPPETVAELLRENSTLLTLHRPEPSTECHAPEEPSEVVYWPYDKQKVKLQFSLQLVQIPPDSEGPERPATSDCDDTAWPEGIGRKDRGHAGPETFSTPPSSRASANAGEGNGGATCGRTKACALLVALNCVSVSTLRGRGPHCSSGIVCAVCKKKDCDVHTINVNSDTKSELYCLEERVPPSDCCGIIMKVMNSECPFLIHNERDQYLRPGNCYQRIILSHQDPESAHVTIFYYKSNKILKPYCGMPVVLNFSKTNYFLVCHSEGNNVLLRIEESTSESLKKITEYSPNWRFIFYMKERQDGTLSFESAQHRGWFINNQWSKQVVGMKRTMAETLNADFIFILVKL